MKNQFKTKLIGVIALVLVSIMCLSSCNSDEMQAEIDAAESNVENVKTEVENVKKSLTDATTELKGLIDAKASATDLSSAVSTLDAAIKEAKDASTKNAADITAVNTAIDAANKAIEDANKAIEDAVKKAADELAAAQKTLNDKIAALEATVKDNKDATDADKADIQEQIDSIATDVAKLSSQANNLDVLVANLTSKHDLDLKDVKGQIDSANVAIDDAEEAIVAVEKDIQGYKDITPLVAELITGYKADGTKSDYEGLWALVAKVEAKKGEYENDVYAKLVNAYYTAEISLYRAWTSEEATGIYDGYKTLIEETKTVIDNYRDVLEEIWADEAITYEDKANLDKAADIYDSMSEALQEKVKTEEKFKDDVNGDDVTETLKEAYDYFKDCYDALDPTIEQIVADIEAAIDALPADVHIHEANDNAAAIKAIEDKIVALDGKLDEIKDEENAADKIDADKQDALQAFKDRVAKVNDAKVAADAINEEIDDIDEKTPSLATEETFKAIAEKINDWAKEYKVEIDGSIADGKVCDAIEGYIDCNNELIDWLKLAEKKAAYEEARADFIEFGSAYAEAVLEIKTVTLKSEPAIIKAQKLYGDFALSVDYEPISCDIPVWYIEEEKGQPVAYFNNIFTADQAEYRALVEKANIVVNGIVDLVKIKNATEVSNEVGEAFTSSDDYEEVVAKFEAKYGEVVAALGSFTTDKDKMDKLIEDNAAILNGMLDKAFENAGIAYDHSSDVIVARQDLDLYCVKLEAIISIMDKKDSYIENNADKIAAIEGFEEQIEFQTYNQILAILAGEKAQFNGNNYSECYTAIKRVDNGFELYLETLYNAAVNGN